METQTIQTDERQVQTQHFKCRAQFGQASLDSQDVATTAQFTAEFARNKIETVAQ